MKKQSILIAIDPGASGATAVRYPTGKVEVFPFESEAAQKELVRDLASFADCEGVPIRAFVELVGGYVRGNSAPGAAMFNFGRNYGAHLMALMSFDIPTELVRPQEWQKGFPKTPKLANKAAAKAQHKRELRDYAARLFPFAKVTLATADALLILNYAMKKTLEI